MPQQHLLAAHLSAQSLDTLATASALRRGQEYFSAQAVHLGSSNAECVCASVEGSEQPSYSTDIHVSHSQQLQYSCTCPVGRTGAFCKHLVATALAWQERHAAEGSDEASAISASPLEYLETLSRKELQSLVLSIAEKNSDFHYLLQMKAAARKVQTYEDWRSLIDWFLPQVSELHWEEVFEFTKDLTDLTEVLEASVSRSGLPLAKAIEYTLHSIAHLYRDTRDEHGHFAGAIRRLQGLHANICERSQLPISYVSQYLHSAFAVWPSWGFPVFADSHFALMGREAAFQLLVTLKEVPCICPNDDSDESDDDWWVNERTLASVRDQIIAMYGTRAEQIEALLEDLNSEAKVLQVRDLYTAEGESEKARMFLQEILESGRFRGSRELVELRVGDCLARHEVSAAQEALFRHFEVRQDWSAYALLQAYAKQAPFDASLLTTAKDFLLSRLSSLARVQGDDAKWRRVHIRDLLLRIFLEEGDIDRAWGYYRTDMPTSSLLYWLLRERSKTHASSVLSILKPRIAALVSKGRVLAEYAPAMEAFELYRDICSAQGLPDKWVEGVQWAQSEWPRLRKLQAALGALGAL